MSGVDDENGDDGAASPDGSTDAVNREFARIISEWDATPSADLTDAPPVPEQAEPGSIEASLDAPFVPPAVHLPGDEDPQFWGIVLGLTLGPIALIVLMLFGDSWSPWWARAAWAGTVGGFVLLILRQPKNREPDDPDDGARV
ncbi:MAG: hypothetical protein ACK5MP_08575 [Nostocoides sp.]